MNANLALHIVYLDTDLVHLITLDQATCYLSVREPSLGKYLNNLASLAPYQNLLAQAPEVKYEFLEAFYSLNTQVSTLNKTVLSDLTQMGWRQAATAAFISLFAPKKEYIPYFQCCLELYPQNEFITQIAIAQNSNTLTTVYTDDINKIQNALQIMKKTPMPLRLEPTEEHLKIMKRESETFRQNYKLLGADAVLPSTTTLLSRYYQQPYLDWVRNGAKPVETYLNSAP